MLQAIIVEYDLLGIMPIYGFVWYYPSGVQDI